MLPSAKRLQKTNWKITMFNGEIHYFDWAIFNSYVSLPDGKIVWSSNHSKFSQLSRGAGDHSDRDVSWIVVFWPKKYQQKCVCVFFPIMNWELNTMKFLHQILVRCPCAVACTKRSNRMPLRPLPPHRRPAAHIGRRLQVPMVVSSILRLLRWLRCSMLDLTYGEVNGGRSEYSFWLLWGLRLFWLRFV